MPPEKRGGCMNNDSISERQQAIYTYISGRHFTAINEISDALDIRPSTVRRDIKKLEQQSRIISYHGGVSVNSGYQKYELRTLKCAEEKQKIGLYAATLVQPNDSLYLGGGSTVYECALALSKRQDLKNVLVVASSVHTASVFLHKEGFKVLLPGGEFTSMHESMQSYSALEFIKSFNFKKSFVGTQALDLHFGYTNPTYELNELKKVVIEHTQQLILLSDHTKIGKTNSFIACGMERINTLVTDRCAATKGMLKIVHEAGTEVIEV